MTALSRRAFLAGSMAAPIAGRAWSQAAPASSRTRLILLGTGGGPRPRAVSSGLAQAHRVGRRRLRRGLRRRRGPTTRHRPGAAAVAAPRVHHPSALRPHRRLRQPAVAGVGGRTRQPRRHLGTAAARQDDASFPGDERRRYRRPDRERGPRAARAAHPRARDRARRNGRGQQRDAGYRHAGRLSTGDAGVRVSLRRAGLVDRHLG